MAVWERIDLKANYSVCLAYLQFLIRDNKLHQSAVYRSHDMYNAFIYNAKGCIMLQHEIANELGVDMGTYIELNVSAHIYKIDEEKVRNFLLKRDKK
jgi:thymidylate synthase